MGFLEGVQTGLQKNAGDRARQQQELTNYVKGFELNPQTGKYEPNDRGQAALDVQSEKVNSELEYLKQKNEMMQAVINEGTMTSGVKLFTMGDIKGGWSHITKNPDVKEKLNKAGIVNASPVDWMNDEDLFQGKLNVTNEILQDPVKVKALNSTFYKVQGPDGKWKLASTENLIQSTGTMGYLPSSDKEAMINRFNKLGSILNGSVIPTPTEEAAMSASRDVNAINAQQTDKYMNEFLQDNPNATLQEWNEFKATLAGTNGQPDYKTVKAMYDAEKSKYSAYNEQMKAKKNANEANMSSDQLTFLNTLGTKKEFTNDDLAQAKIIQGDSKMGAEERKETFGKLSMVSGFINLNKELQSLKAEDVDKNALTVLRDNFASLAGTKFAPGDRKAILKNIDVKTKVGAMVAKYVKFMSGAAVTEGERTMYADLAQAGNWSTLEPMQVAMRAFTQNMMDDTEASFSGYRKIYPKDYILANEDIQKYRKEVNDLGTVDSDINSNAKPDMSKYWKGKK